MEKYVVGVGGANLDMHARSRNPVVMRDSNPSYMHTSAGGVTRNIIENLARQGVSCTASSITRSRSSQRLAAIFSTIWGM